MAIVISPAAEVTLLDVGWSVYEALLADECDHYPSRLAFTGDILEIVSPSKKHETYNRLLEAFVREIGRIWHLEILATGSVTLRAKPVGAEADSSFYVGERAALMRRRETIDLPRDPAPDIAVEIDISRERVDKTRVYALLGVGEFWRYDGRALRAYDLRHGAAVEIDTSIALGGVSIAQIDRFLELRDELDHSELIERWSTWLRENRPR